MTRRARFIVGVLALAAAGCGSAAFNWGRWQEKAGRYEKALGTYMRLAERSEGGDMAPRALFAAGRVAGGPLGDHALARELYQTIVTRYGDRKGWGERAEKALFNTPNYFPLVPNARWEEGDSETGGRNARVRIACRALKDDPAGARLVHSFYAGDKFVKELSLNRVYRKDDLELREYAAAKSTPTVILKYPFEAGNRWTTRRGGRPFVYVIEGTATVKVRAGEFRACLVVAERQPGIENSWKRDYFAPGVGRVLTSVVTPAGERRNTELLSYNIEGADPLPEEKKKP